MAFEATKREWGELYAFFRLLADGYVYSGTPDVRKNDHFSIPYFLKDNDLLMSNHFYLQLYMIFAVLLLL